MKLSRPQLTIPNLVNLVGVVVVVYLLVVLVETVKHNYDLNQQVAVLKAQTDVLKAQTQDLSNNIQYYQTDAFRDREARAKLGLQLPGENVVIIPHSSPAPTPAPDATELARHKPSHFTQWLNFLLGR
ncbi:MAG TPA: septum formation initiator family protein [Candidatus Saccharimonadia bacterium]